MGDLNFIATTTFGLEATVKREVIRLGFKNIHVSDGRVEFTGELSAIPRSNIWLRSADRVLLKLGEFEALSFEELFEKTKELPWQDWITEDGKFTVTGKSVRSQLFSVPDCQAIVKKAVVEKLKQRYNRNWFEETGPEYKIQVALLKDKATLTIDTTGPGLHKRGYRASAVEAPLKETLAAALIELSFFKKDRILYDPMCGSGTIPIEAALIAKNIAPGIKRKFVSEAWPQIPSSLWTEARRDAKDAVDHNIVPEIYGSDIDPSAVELSRCNAEKAGVGECIRFLVRPLEEITLPGAYGVSIINPPYGERIGRVPQVEKLYENMGRKFGADPTWSVYVLTANEDFEKLYGKPADAKRKLFNGPIKTDYYQYYGLRPSRNVIMQTAVSLQDS